MHTLLLFASQSLSGIRYLWSFALLAKICIPVKCVRTLFPIHKMLFPAPLLLSYFVLFVEIPFNKSIAIIDVENLIFSRRST